MAEDFHSDPGGLASTSLRLPTGPHGTADATMHCYSWQSKPGGGSPNSSRRAVFVQLGVAGLRVTGNGRKQRCTP